MKIVRWIVCFPLAMFVSFVVWALIQEALEGIAFGYGGGVLRSAIGLAPIAVSTAVPAGIFVVCGAFVSPSRKRSIAFTFFAFALLFSGGGVEMLRYQEFDHIFWLAACVGQTAGAILGLGAALKMQAWRGKGPNQALQPTPMLVTDRADARSAPSTGVADL